MMDPKTGDRVWVKMYSGYIMVTVRSVYIDFTGLKAFTYYRHGDPRDIPTAWVTDIVKSPLENIA